MFNFKQILDGMFKRKVKEELEKEPPEKPNIERLAGPNCVYCEGPGTPEEPVKNIYGYNLHRRCSRKIRRMAKGGGGMGI